MILSEGTIFGIISGCLTAIGLILSNVGAKNSIKTIILILISLAISDGFSDAFGIYYSTYQDDKNITQSVKEASKAFIGKLSIPLMMATIFYFSNNIILASKIISILVLIVFLLVDYFVFYKLNIVIRFGNFLLFMIIVSLNYYLGKNI
jgi:hypothetical protein